MQVNLDPWKVNKNLKRKEEGADGKECVFIAKGWSNFLRKSFVLHRGSFFFSFELFRYVQIL